MSTVFEVQAIDSDSGVERQVRVLASDQEDAMNQVAKLGLVVERARIIEVSGLISSTTVQTWSPGPVRTPLLISAIGNIVVGLIWMLTIIGIVVAIPMWVLSVFEFRAHARLAHQPRSLHEIDGLRTIAILEIIFGLFNAVSFICGIIALVNNTRLREQAQRLGCT